MWLIVIDIRIYTEMFLLLRWVIIENELKECLDQSDQVVDHSCPCAVLIWVSLMNKWGI